MVLFLQIVVGRVLFIGFSIEAEGRGLVFNQFTVVLC